MLSSSGQRTSSAELSRSFKVPTGALRTGCRPSVGIVQLCMAHCVTVTQLGACKPMCSLSMGLKTDTHWRQAK